MQQQYADCLNICKNWCFAVLFLICHLNKSDSFVQPVGYHSCQIMSDGSASFWRNDTFAVIIGSIITTNHSLVFSRKKGEWMNNSFLENVVF